jgi:Spy/CpxP family protein refolding chaperone
MQLKHLVDLVPTLIMSATLATALVTKAESPDASPAPTASAQIKKLSPEELKARRLTALKNKVGLTADQEAHAKRIIDRYVDDRIAAKGDRRKQQELRTKYYSDIYTILNPDQQQRLLSARRAALRRLKAARESKAPASAPPSASPSPAAVSN